MYASSCRTRPTCRCSNRCPAPVTARCWKPEYASSSGTAACCTPRPQSPMDAGHASARRISTSPVGSAIARWMWLSKTSRFAQSMEAMFLADLENASEIVLDARAEGPRAESAARRASRAEPWRRKLRARRRRSCPHRQRRRRGFHQPARDRTRRSTHHGRCRRIVALIGDSVRGVPTCYRLSARPAICLDRRCAAGPRATSCTVLG